MKLTIKSNGKIHKAKTIRVSKDNKDIHSIEIDFETSDIFSDLEFWLEDEQGNYCDHLGVNVSKRNKLQAHK